MTESAEAIAKAIADARRGRVEQNLGRENASDGDDYSDVWNAWLTVFADPLVPLVDATDIWKQYMASDGARPYEDHVLRPPWPEVIIGYRNSYHNVHLLQVLCAPIDGVSKEVQWESMSDDHTIDWDLVKWVYNVTLWVGGSSTTTGRHLPLTGPMFGWALAVNEDGTMQDLKWVNYSPQQPDTEMWSPSIMTFLAVVNYLNCVNVELVEPHRPRAAQKRITRHLPDTQVSEIRVRPISSSYSGRNHPREGGDSVPLHVVRGHFARYGPEYGRGLLFGKYAGRFWIQGHARGSAEAGTRLHAYTPEPE